MNKLIEKRDSPYNRLPCIWDGRKYIIFSPYYGSMVRMAQEELKSFDLKSCLEDIGFYQRKEQSLYESIRIQKIGFTVTTDCNLNCRHCYANAGKDPSYMSAELALNIIDTIFNPMKDYLLISFFGGEPTLNMKTIKAIVDHTKSIGIPTHYHITTNGVMSRSHLDYIIENNMDVTVSMDGTPELNDFIRISKNRVKASRCIELVIRQLVENNILFQVRATISEMNISAMEYFVDYCADLGVKFIHFEPLSIDGRAKEYSLQLPSPEYFIEKFKQILDNATRREIKVISSFYMNLLTPSEYFCTSLHGDKLLFNPDGSVSLCYKAQSFKTNLSEFIIGRYNQEKNDLVIDKEKKQNWERLTVHDFEKCSKCFAKYICGGGCPQRNIISSGKWTYPDEWICKTKKELIKDAIIRLYKDSNKGRASVVLGSYLYEIEVFKKIKEACMNKHKSNQVNIKKLKNQRIKKVQVILDDKRKSETQKERHPNIVKLERSESCW